MAKADSPSVCLFQVLYLKNLGPRVTMKDLVSLFARFQKEDSPLIQFRLLSGRMRDQAFITFPGELLPRASQFFPDSQRCHILPQGTGLLPSLLSKEKQGNSLHSLLSYHSPSPGLEEDLSGQK